jgi:hypothetical protein
MATLLEVQYKAGSNASAISNTETYINSYIAQAESHVNAESGYNWSDVYSTLNADVKHILTEAASNLAAIYVMAYDPDRWASSTYSNKVNTLLTLYDTAIKLLREKDKTQIFICEA